MCKYTCTCTPPVHCACNVMYVLDSYPMQMYMYMWILNLHMYMYHGLSLTNALVHTPMTGVCFMYMYIHVCYVVNHKNMKCPPALHSFLPPCTSPFLLSSFPSLYLKQMKSTCLYNVLLSIRIHLSPGSSCGLLTYASAYRYYNFPHICG